MLRKKVGKGNRVVREGCSVFLGEPGKDIEQETIEKRSEGGEGKNNMDI